MGLKNTVSVGLVALASWALVACQEEIVTSIGGDLVPVSAVTVEVELPFSDFAGDLEIWGGYGRPYQLPTGIVARGFEGILDARTLTGWPRYPKFASVRDTTGTVRTDTILTFIGGRVVARLDTLSSVHDGPVTLALGAVQTDWDYRSAVWTMAVDSVGDHRPWPEEGGGPVTPMGTAEWDPTESDSVVFHLDSANVALWADSADGARGMLLEAVTEGVRLDVIGVGLLLDTRPSINPDTLVALPVTAQSRTFIYRPGLEAAPGEIWVGGVPAWRTVMSFHLPTTVTGTPEVCAKVGCPINLTPKSVVSASLVLRTKAPHPAFQPTDSLWIDVRPVLEPSRLPKSPLGSSILTYLGLNLEPGGFGEEDGVEVSIPMGSYVEALARVNQGEDLEVPGTLALMSASEPLSLYLASFAGPDGPDGPVLRLILTISEDLGIR